MRKLAATLVLLTLFLSAHAQQKAIDSLKKLITATKEDTSRVLSMNELDRILINSKPDSASLLAQQAMLLSKAAQFPKVGTNDSGGAVFIIQISTDKTV